MFTHLLVIDQGDKTLWWYRHLYSTISKHDVMDHVQLENTFFSSPWVKFDLPLLLKIKFYWKANTPIHSLLSTAAFALQQQNWVAVQSLKYLLSGINRKSLLPLVYIIQTMLPDHAAATLEINTIKMVLKLYIWKFYNMP